MKFAFGLRFLLAPKGVSLSMTHQFLQNMKMINMWSGHGCKRKWLATRFHPQTESFNAVEVDGTGAVLAKTKLSMNTYLKTKLVDALKKADFECLWQVM